MYEENETTRLLRIGCFSVNSLPVLQKSTLFTGCGSSTVQYPERTTV